MEELKDRIKKALDKFNIDDKRRQAREIEAISTHPDFWNDQRTASSKMKELASLQEEIGIAEKLSENITEESKA